MQSGSYICINNKSYESYLEVGKTYYVQYNRTLGNDLYDFNVYVNGIVLYLINTDEGFNDLFSTLREINLKKIINKYGRIL